MISDFIIGLIYDIFMFCVSGHEPLRFNIDSSVYEFIQDFMAFLFFILPINGLKVIFSIIITVIFFRILISVIKTIWELIPFL